MTDEANGRREKVIQIVLVALLATSILCINVVNVADRTVFEADHTSDAFAEADVPERLTESIREEIVRKYVDRGVEEETARQLATVAVTEEQVRAEINRSIEHAYAYITGERSDPGIRLDLQGSRGRLMNGTDDPEILGAVNQTVPEAIVIHESAAGGPLDTARTAHGALPVLTGIATLVALAVVGAFAYTLDSRRLVAYRTGAGIAVAGLASILIGLLVVGVIRLVNVSTEGSSYVDAAVAIDGISRAVESATITLLGQSAFLLVIGLAIVGIIRYSDEHSTVEIQDEGTVTSQAAGSAGPEGQSAEDEPAPTSDDTG